MKKISYDNQLNVTRFVGFSAVVWFLYSHIFGALINHFNLTKGVAEWVVAAISGGGAWIVTVYYPAIAPFILTGKGLLAVLGSAFVVGWYGRDNYANFVFKIDTW